MSKSISLLALAVVAFLALSFATVGFASAASFTNVEFQNGDVAIEGTGGSTVTAKLRVVVGQNEVVERIQTDVLGDNLAPVCVAVGGDKGLEEGTHNVDVQVKLPPNTGTHTLAVQGSGIYGAFKTVDCTSNVVGSASFSGALKVVGGGSSGGDSTIGGSLYQSLLDAINALKSQIDAIKNPPKPAYCASYAASASAGTISLQSWLVQNGFMTQQAMNTGPGIYGPKTTAANAQAQLACK